ncbi:hypothetical protein [Janthinobacterium sp. HLX7-2]|uniref:hypothetical protein n=1 Tax=Janthinobacterium sp. HLX7-2 TaxID=1259331 RepID=UPI003F23D111
MLRFYHASCGVILRGGRKPHGRARRTNLANAAKQQLYNMPRDNYGKTDKPGNAADWQENAAVKTKKLPLAA